MFNQGAYIDDRENELRIIQLKQEYLEKQLQIESLERDRENILKQLTKVKQNSPAPKGKPVGELLEEAKRRKDERTLFGVKRKSYNQDTGIMEKSNKGYCSHRETGENVVVDKKSPKNKIDDFKDYIDREYMNLKLELENLRKCTKTEKFYENSSSSLESISNLSGISTKHKEFAEPLYSIISNPLVSPQNSTKITKKPEFFTPKVLDDFSSFDKFDTRSKAFQFEEKPKLNGILKKYELKLESNHPKFTIESNNIEVFPETLRKTPESSKPKLSDFSNNYSIPARQTARSASNKRATDNLFEKIKIKHKKDKKPPVWKNTFYPVGYLNPYSAYPPLPMNLPQYPTDYYLNSNKHKEEEISENFQPFLKYRYNDEDSFKNEFSENDENNKDTFEEREFGNKVYSNKNEILLSSGDSKENEIYNEKINFKDKEAEVMQTFGKASSAVSDEELKFDGSSEGDHTDLIQKEPILLKIGEYESKTLAQIFKERKQSAAENIKNREENLVRKKYRAKSKKELMEIRKNLVRGSSKNCIPTPRSENKPIGEKRQKSQEIISRLVAGQRAKLSKKEIYELNKRNYKLL